MPDGQLASYKNSKTNFQYRTPQELVNKFPLASHPLCNYKDKILQKSKQ